MLIIYRYAIFKTSCKQIYEKSYVADIRTIKLKLSELQRSNIEAIKIWSKVLIKNLENMKEILQQ